MKIITGERLTEHPLELALDIEPGTTLTEFKEVLPEETVKMMNYDAKDNEIEGQLEEIYSVAMTQVTAISDEMDRVEGRHKARIGEVSATMLNVALSAVREKAAVKMHKDKLSPAGGATVGGGGTVTNNNLIIADRNEIMRMMLAQASQNPQG